jgi:hypothetical protein
VLEAVWTTAALSYNRCFATGPRGMGLTEADVTGTGLRGEVVAWHKVLWQLRAHFASPTDNPRERFEVGAVQNENGGVDGIAITSTPRPALDDQTIRQTGALAYSLSQVVDKRITEQQERLLATAGAMSTVDLERLPLVDIAVAEDA